MREVFVEAAEVQNHIESGSVWNDIPHGKVLVALRKHVAPVHEEDTHGKIAIGVWLDPQLRRQEVSDEIADGRVIGTGQTRDADAILVHRRERLEWNNHLNEMHAANRDLKYSAANAATRWSWECSLAGS